MKSFIHKSILPLIAGLLLLVSPTTADAFKIDTHIWIAQQVLNDAYNGNIRVKLGEKPVSIRLPVRYTRALRNHPKSFLLGSLGPDAIPSVWVGQLVIHPSVSGGWGTGEWLRHLTDTQDLSDQELAYTLGYLIHAASDIFGHSYVNRYAGDVFEISKNRTAALRHILIESYISNYTPILVDQRRGTSVPAYEAVRLRDKTLPVPTDLILRRILFENTAIKQLERSGKAPHITATYRLHQNLKNFLSDDGALAKIERLAIRVAAQALLELPISDEQAEKIRKLIDDIQGDINRITKELLYDNLRKLNDAVPDVFAEGVAGIDKVLGDLNELQSKLRDLEGKVLEASDKIIDAQEKLDATLLIPTVLKNFPEDVCEAWATLLIGAGPCILYKTKDHWKHVPNPAIATARVVLDAAKRLHETRTNEEKRIFDQSRRVLISGLDVIHEALVLVRDVNTHLIDYLENTPTGSIERQFLERWRRNIPKAMGRYVEVNAEAMIDTIDPAGEDPLSHLKDWAICFLPGIAGIPVEISIGVCTVQDGVADIKERIDEFENEVAKLTPITQLVFELKREIQNEIAKLKSELISKGVDEILKGFDQVTNMDTYYFKKALADKATRDDVNRVMGSDSSGQGLLTIADTAQRIEAEMGVKDNGVFDPDFYAVIYNSVVLSKLVLLDQNGLVRLAKLAGVNRTRYGPYLFDSDSEYSQNILWGFTRNIDGNHHWHDLAPPHPRVSGFDGNEFEGRFADLDKRFGYSDVECRRERGMRFWVDRRARINLFKKIFKGPLIPGVDDPNHLGEQFGTVLNSNYPDLFFGETVWSDDGLTLHGGEGEQPYAISGQSPVGDALVISIDEEVIQKEDIEDDGTWTASFSVPLSRVPFQLGLTFVNENGVPLSKFYADVGCDASEINRRALAYIETEVVRGTHLWRIATTAAGDGKEYVEIYKANKDRIKDPDLIFPGQVFLIPDEVDFRVSVKPL